MALRARARAADKCSRGLRRPRDMEGVGSWISAGPRLRWSLVRSFSVVMCARREREAAEGGPELPLELPFEGRKSRGCGSRGRAMTLWTPLWMVTARARIQYVLTVYTILMQRTGAE